MSDLVLASAAASFWPTVAEKGLSVAPPAPPTALRDFSRGDAIAVFARLYDNVRSPSHIIDITTTVRADDGHSIFSSHEERSSEEVQNIPAGYDYSVRFPLKELTPGRYVLSVEVQSRIGNGDPIGRAVPFRIR